MSKLLLIAVIPAKVGDVVVVPVGVGDGLTTRPVDEVVAVVIIVEDEEGILTTVAVVGSDSVRQPPRTASNTQTEPSFLENNNENPPGSLNGLMGECVHPALLLAKFTDRFRSTLQRIAAGTVASLYQ